ncbi:MAG TPA: ferritin-like domain-containing protein [Ktedonobacterales bacterium]
MTGQEPDAERMENVLRTSQTFRPRSTRRKFMERMLLAGGGVAVGAVAGTVVLDRQGTVHATPASAVGDFGNAAVGAERIATAFYDNALGTVSPYGVTGDVAKGTLLNNSHREYFRAARNQEAEHLAVLESLSLSFPFSTFAFPAGTFDSAKAMLAFGEQLENIFIGAYLGAIKAAAASTNDFIAEAAAQILGVECAHRVLIRDIAGEDPPNGRWFEGDITAADGTLGNSDVRATVYATAGDAVNALLALGITPH